MNLGKRILGAVSAGALVLSMSALSAFALAIPVTSVTLGTVTIDGSPLIVAPATTDMAVGYLTDDTAAGVEPSSASKTDRTAKATTAVTGYTVSNGSINFVPSGWSIDAGSDDRAIFDISTPGGGNLEFATVAGSEDGTWDNGTTTGTAAITPAAVLNFTFSTTLARKTAASVTGNAPVGLTNATMSAVATDPLTGKTHEVSTPVDSTGAYAFTDVLRKGLNYDLYLNITIPQIVRGENLAAGKFATNVKTGTVANSISVPTAIPLSVISSASLTTAKELVEPTGTQVRAPMTLPIPVATGNNAQNYIISELSHNTNYAGAIAGSNASNYFKDSKAAQNGAFYTDVYKVNANASFNPSMTPAEYLTFVNSNDAIAVTNGIIEANARYVVKVTFPVETVNMDKFTNDIIINFVGTEGAPNQNSGIPQENTVLSNGNKVVSSNISNIVARINSGNLSSAPLLTLNDKNGKTIASFTINPTGNVTEDNVKAAVEALSTMIVGSNNATGNNAWNAFVKENPDAKSYAFQFTKDATFKNFTVSVTMNNMPSGVASGTVYKEVNGKMAEQGNYSVSGNSSSFTLKGCSNYRLVYGKLSSVILAAGEGTTDSADDVVAETTVDEANVPETLPLVNDEAPVAEISTVAAVNPSTGNAPIALAVIPVAIAAAVVIAKKSR